MTLADAPPESHAAPSEAIGRPTRRHTLGSRLLRRAWRFVVFLWKFALAMLCTQNPVLSILLVGWATRCAQRAAVKHWWRAGAGRRSGQTLDAFLSVVDPVASQVPAQSPNWIVQHDLRINLRRSWLDGWRATLAGSLRACFHSLWLNARIGIQVILNTWALTLPGCILMLFAWAYGWNNSFHKGYEQAHVGPLTGVLGILLFIAALMYVPLATARQAATGEWRSFYDFRLVTRLIARRPFLHLGLAVAFTLVALPVNILKTAPGFLTAGGGEFAQRVEAMTAEEARAFLASYYFWASTFFVGAFVGLRLIAARVYASALLAEIRRGTEMPLLAPLEQAVLARLDLLNRHQPHRHFVWRALGWTSRRSTLAAAVTISLFVWFTFVSQTYVSEFLNYHPEAGRAWLNHPLVQLPYFRFIPAALSS